MPLPDKEQEAAMKRVDQAIIDRKRALIRADQEARRRSRPPAAA
jgi:hypothetical protein